MAILVPAARAYRASTRREAGNLRCELWQATADPHAFTLLEAFRDAEARSDHALSEHARKWHDTLTPLLVGAIDEELAESLLHDPVPPPLPGRPALESSQPFGGVLQVGQQSVRLPQLTVDLESIEVGSAHDPMPFRAAQPCVVLGAFVLSATGVHGVGRTVYRFTPPKALPASMTGEQRLLDVPVSHGSLPLKLAILVASVEENGGTDVRALYQTLADAHDLSFWSRGDHYPTPRTLAECAGTDSFANTAHPVELLRNERAVSDSVEDDTWCGAALGCFDLTPQIPERLARFHTAAETSKNDWLLTLKCRVA